MLLRIELQQMLERLSCADAPAREELHRVGDGEHEQRAARSPVVITPHVEDDAGEAALPAFFQIGRKLFIAFFLFSADRRATLGRSDS